jgi:hypothetical protein
MTSERAAADLAAVPFPNRTRKFSIEAIQKKLLVAEPGAGRAVTDRALAEEELSRIRAAAASALPPISPAN